MKMPRGVSLLGKILKRRSRTDAAYSRRKSEEALISQHFDAAYYLAKNADVASANVDPLDHFLQYGWREGRNPNASFDVNVYLSRNPAAGASGSNPFYLYLLYGKSDDIRVKASLPDEGAAATAVVVPSEFETSVVKRRFDHQFYSKENSDVVRAGVDPLSHFMHDGWREGRDPTPWFNVREYLAAHADVKEAQVNPFYHYLVIGEKEGRLLRRRLSNERRILSKARSGSATTESWKQGRPAAAPIGAEAFARALDRLIPSHRDRLLISVGHDDYTINSGGIQNCIRDEQATTNHLGASHVSISPSNPGMVTTGRADAHALLHVLVDGERIGHVQPTVLLQELAKRGADGVGVVLVIHSMLGHDAETLIGLFRSTAARACAVWIHDCSTLCSNYALLRNDLEFCWSPKPTSTSCAVCVYGQERSSHLAAVNAVFAAVQPQVLFPSEVIKNFWIEKDYHAYKAAFVVPHGHATYGGTRRPLQTANKVRVAFVGAAAAHKGWHIFTDLARSCREDPRYTFLHFASFSGNDPCVDFVATTVTHDDRNAMVEALLSADIDIVVQWSLCFETFSFSTYEAILAGTWIVARQESGNASTLVASEKVGVVLPNQKALFSYFKDGHAVRELRAYRSNSVKTGSMKINDSVVNRLFGVERHE